ncbi:DUF4352 domain-containing protein [Jeotgalibacillus sp. ET6]|uniref:DUF4352 domain-containing protein n=1 Tax=Jeotgalibacillus sp. ET6 TaxID=3037260 RepID=UPI00241834F6|nr:DUF4352 domain-containing protein [Jeotgalibacillus sp. ET6]MDG5471372.1 DUF4352 domain-containing protein [Jeotgalibacillus sp. ET6]
MKKLSFLLLVMAMFAVSACSSQEDTSKASAESEETEEQSVEVDKGLLNVELTIPASMFEGEDIDQVIAEAKEDGVKEATKNDDGSVTYKMSKSAHKEMMQEFAVSMKESLDEMVTSEDFVSIKAVDHNKSFDKFTLTVDQEAYENSFDGFGIFALGMSGMFYQVYDGKDMESAKVTISLVDEATQEEFDTLVYPDDMEEATSETEEVSSEVSSEVYTVGDTVNIEGMELTINSASFTSPAEYSEAANGTVLTVDVSLKNTNDEQVFIDNTEFAIYDAEGIKMDDYYGYDDMALSDSVNSGKQVNGKLYFDVTEQDTYEMIYTPSFSWESVEITFDITPQ